MRLIMLLTALAFAGASPRSQSAVEVLATPAGADSGMYSLSTGADGHTYLIWIEPVPAGGHALRFSRLGAEGWHAPVDIARASNWFVNWADHPSLTASADGRLYAHWLVNTGRKEGSYGYGIHVATSDDAGRTWRTAFEEGMRNVKDYAGFLSFLPTPDGVEAVFLTPVSPDTGTETEHERTKTLGVVRLSANGAVTSPRRLDADVCSCCSTDMAMTAAGPIAVYRDHDAGEIRDISIVRQVGGRWTAPAAVHRDGWRIAGCPTNGPAVAATGTRVAVAWFTAAADRPAVNLAFSSDGGASFGAPIRVDDGAPVGWPDVHMLDDGRTLVSWLERTSEGKGEVRVREVGEGPNTAAVTVAATSSGRATGMPMMAHAGSDVIVAWRDGRVRTARVRLPVPSREGRRP